MKYRIVTGEQAKQGSDAWLAARREKFNASETPALFGLNPWKPRNALELAHLKFGDLVIEDNPAMRRGRELEGKVREMLEWEHDRVFAPVVIESLEDPRFRASMDGLTLEGDLGIEIKVSDKTYDMVKSGSIPKHYWYQVQHQLFVSGASAIIFAAYSPSQPDPLAQMTIERDDEAIAEIREKWDEFEKEFVGKELPPLEVEREDFEWSELVADYKAAKSKLEVAEERFKQAKQRLIEAAGGVKTHGFGITVTPVKQAGRIKYAAIFKDRPELLDEVDIEKYTSKPTVTYRITEEKNVQ